MDAREIVNGDYVMGGSYTNGKSDTPREPGGVPDPGRAGPGRRELARTREYAGWNKICTVIDTAFIFYCLAEMVELLAEAANRARCC
jgi:hypothetical protein